MNCVWDIHIYVYVCLHVCEINGKNDGTEELGLFCCYKVLRLPVKYIVLIKSGHGLTINGYCKL